MSLQGILFPPESRWRPPRLAELPQDWNLASRLGLDTETCDLLLRKLGIGCRRGAYICGVSLAFPGHRAFYLPTRHLGGDNMEEGEAGVLRYLRDQAAAYTGEVVGARLSYDLDHLEQVGVVFPHATFKDVQVAEPLLDELQYSYSLDAILGRWGLEGKDEGLLRQAAEAYGFSPKDTKLNLHKLAGRFVGPYAEADAYKPLELIALQEAEIEKRGLQAVWALECEVLPVTVAMRRRGVPVDFDQLDRVERYAIAEENKAWGELHRLTGVSVRLGDAMKPEGLARAFAAVGVPVSKTSQGKPSITKEWLETVDHPAGKVIRRARKMSHLRTMFVASVRQHAVNGRIHATFNQTVMEKEGSTGETAGAAYGRFSCTDPNMQFQPARDPELGPMWRKVYPAEPGTEWCSADYSQQEPGLALHFALASGPGRIGERAYKSAMEAAERKRNDPSMDYHTMFTAMVHGNHVLQYHKKDPALKLLRDPCKNIYLGICYGEGDLKLCKDLHLPTLWVDDPRRPGVKMEVAGPEGRALLTLVDDRVPYIKATAKSVESAAKSRGYVMDILGGQYHFESGGRFGYEGTHRGFNRIIQGSAARQTKRAMVDLHRAGCPLQLQVHDEVDFPAESREVAQRYGKMMEEAIPLSVPIKVDLEFGPSWGEIA